MRWPIFNTNRALYFAIALTSLMTVVILFISIRQSREAKNSTRWVNHTQEILHHISGLIVTTDEMASAVHEYVISGEPHLPDLNMTDRRKVDSLLAGLRKLVANNPVQLAHTDSLHRLFSDQAIIFGKLFLLCDRGKQDSAMSLLATGTTEYYDIRISHVTAAMEKIETEILEERKVTNDRSLNRLNLVLYSVITLISFLILFILFIFKKYIERHKAREKEFRDLLNAAPDAMIAVDESGLITSSNRQAKKMFGYSTEEMLQRPVEMLMPGSFAERHALLRRHYQATTHSGLMGQGRELPAQRKDGSEFMVEVTLSPIEIQSGRLVIASIRDTTQRRKARRQVELLSQLVDRSNEAIFTVDTDRRIQTWNSGAESIYEYSKADALGKNPADLLQTDPSPEYTSLVQAAVDRQGYWSGEMKRTTKSGKDIIVNTSVTALKDENGILSGYISVSHDITQQKQLREELDHLASMVEQSSEAIISRGLDGRLISWNKGAEKLMGFTREEALGKTIVELGAMRLTKEEAEEIKRKILENGAWESEQKYYHKNGSCFIGAVVGYSLRSENGDVRHFVFIIKDISLRKQLEEKLKKSNEDLESFSYSVSHDLRAPLRGIIGFTTVLEEDYAANLDDEARRITSIIKKNTLKMGELIDDLLAFSRMGRHEIDKISFNTRDVVNDIVANLEKKGNLTAVKWHISDLPPSWGDFTTIRQVWVNLISNAVKYSSGSPQPIIEIGSYTEDGQAVFFVRDNGVGFDEKYSGKLFKVFQRLHTSSEFEGTGVGLAIVEKIVSKHNGRVWAKGEPEKGACFYFSLPINGTHAERNYIEITENET